MSQSQYRIEPATLSDCDTLARMRRDLQQTMESENHALWPMPEDRKISLPKYFAECLTDPEVLVLVVRHQSSDGSCSTVATATARIGTGRDVLRYGMVDDVWVDIEYRGFGLCRSLVMRLLDFFEDHNTTQLQLGFVYGGAAGAMWQHLGFQPTVILAQTTVAQLRGG